MGDKVFEYYYDAQGIVGFKYDGAVYYFKKNLMGDIDRIYDANKNLVAEYKYDAWGNHRVYTGTGIDITDNSSYNSSVAKLNPFRYRGYYYDSETGLYYLNSRYYDPSVGRFINADDISYIQPTDINGLNLFAYCGNNPVMYTDPEGTFAILSFLISLGISLAITSIGGTIIGGISAGINGENIANGMLNGFITGAMFGVSIGLIATGVGTPLAGTALGATFLTAGVTGAFMLGANLNAQLKNGGFGNVNTKSMLHAWGAGTILGGLSGALGYAFSAAFTYYGQILGLTLAGKTFLGVSISKVYSNTILHALGGALGGFIGGQFSGKIMQYISTDVGVLDYSIPTWLASLIRLIFKL